MKNEVTIFRDANEEIADYLGVTCRYYPHPLTGYQFTENVFNAKEFLQCDWLIDEIMTFCKHVVITSCRRQIWKLERDLIQSSKGEIIERNNSFTLSCSDEKGIKIYSKYIICLSFPSDLFTLHFQNGTLFLPAEDVIF